MKTAEEWANRIQNSKESWADLVQMIQLDAFKAGMTEALEIHMAFPPSEHWECSNEIRKQRDSKTNL